MIKFSAAAAAFSLFATSAAAATVVDVDNLLVPPTTGSVIYGYGALSATAPTFSRTQHVLQTWTVTTTGRLDQIDLFGGTGTAVSYDGISYVEGSLDFDVTLSIFGGGTKFSPGNLLLGSVTKNAAEIAILGVTSFDISGAGIRANAGDVLTFQMSVESCPSYPYCARSWSNWTDFSDAGGGTTYGYTGGMVFNQDNGIVYPHYTRSLNFRTWVSEVPEPGTWRLMILGFAAVGAGLRRRGERRAL